MRAAMPATQSNDSRDSSRERLNGPPDIVGLRIVLAEDDKMMRELVAVALRRDGFEVIEVADGNALAKLASAVVADELEICLMITDIRMPGRSGLAALPILARSGDAPPVLLITAFGDAATHEAAARLGAAGVIDKPFEIDDLRTVVWHLARAGRKSPERTEGSP